MKKETKWKIVSATMTMTVIVCVGISAFFLALGLGPIVTPQERCEDYVRDNLPGWKDAISTNTGGGWTPRYECWATDPGGARARVY